MRNVRFFLCFCLCLALAPMVLKAQIRQLVPLELEWNGVAQMHFGSDTLLYIALENGEYDGRA